MMKKKIQRNNKKKMKMIQRKRGKYQEKREKI